MKTLSLRALVATLLASFCFTAMAGEAVIRKALASLTRDESAVVSVQKTPYANLYEVVLANGDIVYADEKGGFLIHGELIDLQAKKSVTAERQKELSRINIAELPLQQAVKQVRGNGRRTLITFEDPNCGYCKTLAKDLRSAKDVTIYVFMIGILSPDSVEKSRNIWCAKNRSQAWNDWMTENKVPAEAKCDAPIAKNGELAKKYRVSGTPTMFLADGTRLGGYLAPADLEAQINEAEARAKARK